MKYYISIIILALCLVFVNNPVQNTSKKELPQKEVVTKTPEVVSQKETKQVPQPEVSTSQNKKEVTTSQPKKETIKKEATVQSQPPDTKDESLEESANFSSSQQTFIRSQLLIAINNERTSPVNLYSPLLKSSTLRAKEAYQKWSHTRPNNTRWNTSLQGIIDIKHVLHGENLAKTQIEYKDTYTDNDLISLCQTIHQGLVHSPTHYQVMTNPNYKNVNLGIYTVVNKSTLVIVVAQHYTQ